MSRTDPFQYSFGQLRNLLIAEEIIKSSSKDSELRNEISNHISDNSILNMPLKHQMAWVVKDLGLQPLSKSSNNGPPSVRSTSESNRRGSSMSRTGTPRRSRSSTPSSRSSSLQRRGNSIRRSGTPDSVRIASPELGSSKQFQQPPPLPSTKKVKGKELPLPKKFIVKSPMVPSRVNSQSTNSMSSVDSPRSSISISKQLPSSTKDSKLKSATNVSSFSNKPLPKRSNLIDQKVKKNSSSSTASSTTTLKSNKQTLEDRRKSKLAAIPKSSPKGKVSSFGRSSLTNNSNKSKKNDKNTLKSTLSSSSSLKTISKKSDTHNSNGSNRKYPINSKSSNIKKRSITTSLSIPSAPPITSVPQSLAWQRIIHFLRDNPKGAKSVEGLFESLDGEFHKNLSSSELAAGLMDIGIILKETEIMAFHDDIDTDNDGLVSLAEFANFIKTNSLRLSQEEKHSWENVFCSVLPGAGGEFGGAAEEAISDPIRRIEVLFNAADLDGSGDLQINELAIAMNAMGISMSEVQLALFSESIDLNNDGKITLDEFIKVFDSRHSAVRDMAWVAFIHLIENKFTDVNKAVQDIFIAADVNQDGMLDLSELAAALNSVGIRLSLLQLRLIRDDIDFNGDGLISLEEFKDAIKEKSGIIVKNKNNNVNIADKLGGNKLTQDINLATSQAVAWRRIIVFLRDNPEGASIVESFFKTDKNTLHNKKKSKIMKNNKKSTSSKLNKKKTVKGSNHETKDNDNDEKEHDDNDNDDDGDDEYSKKLTCRELGRGLISLGVMLDDEKLIAFHKAMDKDNDGHVSLSEFILAVGEHSQLFAQEEIAGWEAILESVMPGAGGEFGGAAEEAISDPIRRIEVLFNAADLDGSGDLQINELAIAMNAMGISMSEVQLALFSESIDLNNDGKITLDEFFKVFDSRHSAAKDMAWVAFIHLIENKFTDVNKAVQDIFIAADVNQDGMLDLSELAAALNSVGIRLSLLQLRLIRDDIDFNGDGLISLEEFKDAIHSRTIQDINMDNDNAGSDNLISFGYEKSPNQILVLTWQKILNYIRDCKNDTAEFENLFTLKNGTQTKMLTGFELTNGLLSLGISLNPLELKYFQDDLICNYKPRFLLSDFIEIVRIQSLSLATEERDGWINILSSLLPDGGGEFVHFSAFDSIVMNDHTNKDVSNNVEKNQQEIIMNRIDAIFDTFSSTNDNDDNDGGGDDDGHVNIYQLGTAMSSFGIDLSDVQIALFCQTIDVNHNNTITKPQFTKIFNDRHRTAQKHAWLPLIQFFTQSDNVDKLETIFNDADLNNDNLLNIDEFQSALHSIGISLDPLQLRLVRNDIDLNDDGYIALDEFQKVIAKKTKRRKMSEDHHSQQNNENNDGNDEDLMLIVEDKDALLAMAWRRVITYLRKSKETAKNVEKLFKKQTSYRVGGKSGSTMEDKVLSCDELTKGLISIGIHLENKVAKLFHDDVDVNKDGVVSLSEFALSVERYSSFLAEEETQGWSSVLTSLVPGAGGEFGGAAEEAISDPIRRIEVLFNAADLDGSGDLQINELAIAMRSLGVTMSDTQLALFYETLDTNGDGSVSLDEFLKVFDDQNIVLKETAWSGFLQLLGQRFSDTKTAVVDLFTSVDVNQDGLLDINEFEKALNLIGIKLDPLQLRLVRDDIDANGDGFVSLEELINFIDDKIKFGRQQAQAEKIQDMGGVYSYSNDDDDDDDDDNGDDKEEEEEIEVRQRMIAWRRILHFLRHSPEEASSVEKLFENDQNTSLKDKVLNKYELASGLVALGIHLDDEVIEAFHNDIDVNNDGVVSLSQFALSVEAYSFKIALEEKQAWTSVLGSLVPGAGGEFDFSSDEVLYDPIKRVEVLFNAADLDGSGDLQINELAIAMRSLGVTMSDTQLALFYETLDTNGDGSVSLNEFLTVFESRHSSAQNMSWAAIIYFIQQHYDDLFETIQSMFQQADKDNDGLLNLNELDVALQSIGVQLGSVQLKLVRDDIDINGDGFVSLEEFMTAIDEKMAETKKIEDEKMKLLDQLKLEEEKKINSNSNHSINKTLTIEQNENKQFHNSYITKTKTQNEKSEFENMIIDNHTNKGLLHQNRVQNRVQNDDNDDYKRNEDDDDTTLAILFVTWRKIIDFLRLSTSNAKAAESLFQSVSKSDEKNMNLSISELIHGLKLLGVKFNIKEINVLENDLKTKLDHFISLIEFANYVEEFSLKIQKDEKEGWNIILKSMIPQSGGIFIGSSTLNEKDMEDPIKRVELLFNAADLDGSGDLQIRELYFAMKSLGITLSDTQLALFYDSLDLNKDGRISLNEFSQVFDKHHSAAKDLAWVAFVHFIEERAPGEMEESIDELFNLADSNHDGQLDLEELKQAFHYFGMTLSPLQLKLIRDDMDVNGDGSITIDEFRDTIHEKSQNVNVVLARAR